MERTTLLRTDNTAGLWWQRKGSATCTFDPEHLLQLQPMHQQFHHYVPCIDFVGGVDNLISDRPSRSSDLTNNQLLANLESNPPQALPWRLWTPPPKLAWNSFSTATEDIREELYFCQATAADVHWTKWAYFCARATLDPLLVTYNDPVPILNAFSRDYRTGNIVPNSCAVQSRTVEDAIC